jgi:hypothetical protein
MKKICLILCVVTSPLVAQQVATLVSWTPRIETAAFTWTSTSYDFGKIPLNKPVAHEFRFTNAGTTPLIISSVQASCGCTVTDYSNDPISPGEEGFVKATYNAAKAGMFTKTVTVNANADESIVQLIIKGEVVE